ncbi:unnamed protein product [Staurois parvus]|uniref:Uncharacterized protein n=1 Tax=Staurois parvus TaxID=386267 RepID=A0ABN9G454_9NEOB|nr:unnamed protein product [Staurois parvus]
MGPPTDPGPSGSAQVSKWSVRPCSPHTHGAILCYLAVIILLKTTGASCCLAIHTLDYMAILMTSCFILFYF